MKSTRNRLPDAFAHFRLRIIGLLPLEEALMSSPAPTAAHDSVPPIAAGTLERLREAVLLKRPILREILRKKGSLTLLAYANDYVDVNMNPPILNRQSELLSTIHEATKERFGETTAQSVVLQLEKYYFVSTADHTGPITHPFFVNSNLLSALAIKHHSDPVLQNIIVLACSNVSVDNSSFPRGLFFHTATKETLTTHRLPFFSANTRPPTVYALPAYDRQVIDKLQHQLTTKIGKKEIDDRTYERLRALLQDVYGAPDIFQCPSYGQQISKTNQSLWKEFFRSSDVKLPNLIYLEVEDIVVRLLTKHHLIQDTVLNHVLFDPRYEPFINEYFEGIFGSFSRSDATGTYLFWALPPGARYNQQLWRKGRYLITKDESFKIELHPEALRDAMLSKQLIPNLLLNFMTVSFYYGLKCLGGFNQVNYLTLMKNAYIKMNVDLGNYRSIEVCARAQTKEICDGLSIAFMGYDTGRVALASGVDLLLRNDPHSWERLVTLSKEMTLEEAINPLLPEIYRISYDEKEWEPDLLQLSERTIHQMTGLDKKVRPCIEIR